MNKMRGLYASLLAVLIYPTFLSGFGQSTVPIKVSLRGTGSPQFPTGFWVSNSDPHFRHSRDQLFWLSTDEVATTFFKEYCCRSGGNTGVRYSAAIFDIQGNKLAMHDWTSMPDDPVSVGGGRGFFWVRSKDYLDALKTGFNVAARIPLADKAVPVFSRNGNWIAVRDGSKLSIYTLGGPSTPVSVELPEGALVADIYGDTALLNGPRTSCYVKVWQAGRGLVWAVDKGDASAQHVPGRCNSGEALLSEDEVLIKSGLTDGLEIVHRDDTVETIPENGKLTGMTASGRFMFETFHPNELAEKLDMDFGGQKEIVVYDSPSKTVIFRKMMGGQAGAALAPDGHHLAIIEGSNLLIYSLP
jgi:hypothetical protein